MESILCGYEEVSGTRDTEEATNIYEDTCKPEYSVFFHFPYLVLRSTNADPIIERG